MNDTNIKDWLSIVLQERFGVDFLIAFEDGFKLRLPNEEKAITFAFSKAFYQLGQPNFSTTTWHAESEGWQSALIEPLIVLGDLPTSPLIALNHTGASIQFDLPGLVYWCLSRAEEVDRQDLDQHNRFPAKHSHAYQHGYLERPIVDEWLYILGQVLQKIYPNVQFKENRFSVKVSHDVDAPSQFGFVDLRRFIRRCGASLLLDKNIKNVLTAPWVKIRTKEKLLSADAYNSFDWIMSLSEKYGLTSAFYFICGQTDAYKDADYQLGHSAIRTLMREIYKRGHEIGLHPSYNTYLSVDRIKSEFSNLQKICAEEGIKQHAYGGRMHYLRWQHPYTMQAWNDAGLAYDSTLSYADHAGFRCGTCFEYPAINPVTQKMLTLRLRPLIAMECSVIGEAYMALGVGREAREKFLKLADRCRKVGGCFTMLWHNSEFSLKSKKALYENLLSELVK